MLPEMLKTDETSDSSSVDMHSLDTSTPMLVKFGASIPTSPLKTDEEQYISKTLVFHPTITSSMECDYCLKHKKQIDTLLEKQLSQEKQIELLRKEYDEKCLSKSPDFMLHSTSSSISSSSLNEDQDQLNNQTIHASTNLAFLNQSGFKLVAGSQVQPASIASTLKRQNSSTTTLVAAAGNVKSELPDFVKGMYNYNSSIGNAEPADWMKYWSSRPQTQPPK